MAGTCTAPKYVERRNRRRRQGRWVDCQVSQAENPTPPNGDAYVPYLSQSDTPKDQESSTSRGHGCGQGKAIALQSPFSVARFQRGRVSAETQRFGSGSRPPGRKVIAQSDAIILRCVTIHEGRSLHHLCQLKIFSLTYVIHVDRRSLLGNGTNY